MVAAAIMGIEPREVPTFSVAHQSGMKPVSLDDIEIRGEKIPDVARTFARATIVPWHTIKDWFGARRYERSVSVFGVFRSPS